ncbi:heavy metal translocating P-type ATPase [Lampropedia cohaerens]|uniref:heavy metal translocating P-type ATPase n=1 Tax=Lampropedia cohaerens TaxID=1610491 RepID=UPI00069981B1|nr:heavy metal translocating P-type ATPase [Lampropedia cohaerens]
MQSHSHSHNGCCAAAPHGQSQTRTDSSAATDTTHGHTPAPAGCGCDHASGPGWPRLIAALLLALAAELAHLLGGQQPWLEYGGMALAVIAIALAGLNVYQSGVRALLRGRLGIDTLMAVAVTGAALIDQWPEAAMVMALYAIAERIEHAASERARNAIAALMQLAPEQAEVRQTDGTWRSVPVASVAPGAQVRVRPGGRVPFDGTVLEGSSAVDQASVTGESLPVEKQAGDSLFAGTLNTTGELVMQVTAAAGNTTLDRIIAAVEQAQATRAPTQRFIERFAAIYTPGVFVLALGVALLTPPLLGWPWLQSVYQALVLLVIACPCALVISVPVTIVSGLTAAARRNIIIKGGSYLEDARKLRTIAFDKTGTITSGKPTLVQWQAWADADAAHTARVAAALSERSDHPVSQAIAHGLGTPADAPAITVRQFEALAGRGVKGVVEGKDHVLVNHRTIEERGQCSPALDAALAQHQQQGQSVSVLADADGVLGLFAVADTLKPQARQAMQRLQAMGIRTLMLSGDNQTSAEAIAAQAGITQARGELLPQDKLQAITALRQQPGLVGMVGDGINDAPALAQADIGFAMGGAGTDVALEAADVVIMNDDVSRVADTIDLSRRTHRVLMQNIAFALGVKAVFFALALTGQATMWMAVFADVGASLLVVANGMRLLRWRGMR